MMCSNCSKLASIYTTKKCMRCQGAVSISIAVLCETCSATSKQCSVCMKKSQANAGIRGGGCNCGKK